MLFTFRADRQSPVKGQSTFSIGTLGLYPCISDLKEIRIMKSRFMRSAVCLSFVSGFLFSFTALGQSCASYIMGLKGRWHTNQQEAVASEQF